MMAATNGDAMSDEIPTHVCSWCGARLLTEAPTCPTCGGTTGRTITSATTVGELAELIPTCGMLAVYLGRNDDGLLLGRIQRMLQDETVQPREPITFIIREGPNATG